MCCTCNIALCFRYVVADQILGLHCIEVTSYDCCHQMLDFMTKMHQIRFWLRLCPRPRWRVKGVTHRPIHQNSVLLLGIFLLGELVARFYCPHFTTKTHTRGSASILL